jgi:hypothetical protein
LDLDSEIDLDIHLEIGLEEQMALEMASDRERGPLDSKQCFKEGVRFWFFEKNALARIKEFSNSVLDFALVESHRTIYLAPLCFDLSYN